MVTSMFLLLLFFFWYNLPTEVALIATIILISWAIYKHNQSLPVEEAQSKPDLDNEPNTQLIVSVLLYLELKRQHRLGHLSTNDYNYLIENIDIIYNKLVRKLGITESEHQIKSVLEMAWILLKKQVGDNLGAPPWRSTPQLTLSPVPAKEKSATQKSPVPAAEIQMAAVADSPTITPPPQPTSLPKIASDSAQATLPPVATEQLSLTQAVEEIPLAVQPIIAPPQSVPLPKALETTEVIVHTQQKKKTFTWLPRQFNREVFTRLLLPFLWQNLGWFIGGFCFISGSVFLVTYTTGFANAVTVFVILYFYTLLLFWGSYQIRRRRPQLLTASHVLSTLAVLLVPLDLAAATRLIQSSLPNLGLVSLTTLGVVITVGLLVVAIRLASGMMERHLQNEHPYLFIALASLQLAIPIVNFIPHWLVLAGLHVSLLSLLSYALWRFSQQWLYAIFIEPHPVAYYAAGTLIYAAIVTFIHSIWSSSITLPAGYVGPFLMALCFLLLQVDIQFKQWVHKQALLSHFTFVIYGLSVVAVLYSWVGLIPITLTLMIGSVVYGMMLWNYLTLPPLYLLLACLSGLYGLLILQHFPYHWYFLLSLPGLSSLMGLHRWAQQRHSIALAVICYRVIFSLGLGLFIWSLYHATPGEIGWLTAIVATVITTWRWQKPVDFYPLGWAKYYQSAVFTGLITVTLAYTPLYLGLSWITQFSSGLVILSVLWSAWGLFVRRVAKESATAFVNSALLSLIVSVILVAIYLPTSLPGLLVAVSGVLLWLSLSLYSRTLFYLTLIALGTAGIVFKYYYLPESSGKGIILLAVGVWMLLWWLHYRIIYLPARSATSKPVETIANPPDFTLLGLLTLSPTTYANRFELLKSPLEQTLVLAWLIGLGSTLKSLILINSLAEISTSSWSSTLIWNAIVTALIVGQLQRLELIPLAMVLFTGALWTLGSVQVGWLLAITGAVLIWTISLFIFSRSRSWMSFLSWPVKAGIRPLIEQIIHWTVVAICFASLAGVMSFNFALVQLTTLAVAILFFAWAGWRYQLQLHSYMVIGCSILSLPILSFSLFGWLSILLFTTIPLYLLTLLAIGLAVLAHLITQSPLATLYSRPLYHTAYFSYLLSLISGLYLLEQPNTSYDGKSLVGIFTLLAFGQLPLLRSWVMAPMIRGIGIALLLSLAGFVWVSYSHPDQFFWFTWLWALILWGMGHYGLPHFNNRWSQWAIEPTFWPILGFGLLITVFSWKTLQLGDLTWQTVISLTFYFVLMLRNTDWKWLPWLVGLALMVSGWIVLFKLSPNLEFFILGITLWINLLFWLSRIIQRSSEIAHWPFQRLVQPLLIWSISVIGLQLLGLSFITLGNLFPFFHHQYTWPNEFLMVMVWAILLNFSYFHLVSVSMQSVFAHALILSLLNTTLLLLSDWVNTPLLLSLWTGGLLLYFQVNNPTHPIWLTTLATWLELSFAAALLSLLLWIPVISINQGLLTLSLLAALSFMFGWFNIYHQTTRGWLVSSVILAGLFLHLIWLMMLPPDQPTLLLPWYALQNGLLMWGTFWLRTQDFAIAEDKKAHFYWLLKGLTPVLASLGLLSLLWAQGVSISALWNNGHQPFSFFAQSTVIFTYLLLLMGWWRYSPWQETDREIWIGSLAILIAGLGIYFRLLGVGFAPPSVWDTAIPLLLSLGTGGLLFHFQVNNHTYQTWLILRAIWLWLSLVAALLSLILISVISINERLLTLGLLTSLSFMFSGFKIHTDIIKGGLVGGVFFLGAFLHLMWLVILPQAHSLSFLPWYALQDSLLMWGTFWLRTKDFNLTEDKQAQLRWLLRGLIPVLASLGLLSLLWAQGVSISALWNNGHQPFSFFAQSTVIFTYLLLLMGWWRYSPWQETDREIWIGSLAILIAGLGIYFRLLGVGFAPISVWDTAVLMGSSYVLLAIQHLYPAYPLYRLTLLIPGLAILTVPLQLESIQASMALVAAAILYLLIPRRSQQNLPLYLGLLALNVGLYLWVPSLAQDYKLLQVYTIPAALSLLVMLQLHELELKPSVLNAIRLVALSTLYASASLDVFLQEALSIFILALALSLAGVILGIALRIRVFLYSSTVFLVLNVVGQLIQFYPEGRLGKAIILMILGGLITAGMIWFSIQREIFLQRIDNMRANLATWA